MSPEPAGGATAGSTPEAAVSPVAPPLELAATSVTPPPESAGGGGSALPFTFRAAPPSLSFSRVVFSSLLNTRINHWRWVLHPLPIIVFWQRPPPRHKLSPLWCVPVCLSVLLAGCSCVCFLTSHFLFWSCPSPIDYSHFVCQLFCLQLSPLPFLASPCLYLPQTFIPCQILVICRTCRLMWYLNVSCSCPWLCYVLVFPCPVLDVCVIYVFIFRIK